MSFKKLKTRASTIKMANNATALIQDYFAVPVQFSDSVYVIHFFILPSSSHKFLLGVDFWQKAKLSLTYKDEQWCIESIAQESQQNNGIIKFHDLSDTQKQTLNQTIDKFRTLCTGELGRSNVFEHTIDTGDSLPIFQRAYPISPAIEQRMFNELQRMKKLKVVEPANSPWCQPPVLVKKKNGKDRLCIDSRALNRVTVKSKYAIPHIESILSRLGKAKFISSIDLQDAFWQIPLDKNSKPKTAFNIPGHGMWQFTVVPFGLTTSAQAMQRLMDYLFHDEGEFIFIDDIIVASESFDEHMQSLKKVFEKLRSANLTVNFDKCQFCLPQLKYLGFVVDSYGLRTDPEKVECIANFPRPRTQKELKRFIGMASWYRKFVRSFAKIAAPIHELTKGKSRIIKWTEQAKEAFDTLKNELIKAPVLATPDFTKKFIIQCDASNYALGAVLVQIDDETGAEKPIAFISRKLRGAELNYSTTEKECLSVVFAVEKFRHYVEGFHFEIITDHSALLWLFKQQNLSGRLARWMMKLQQYDFEIKQVKGKKKCGSAYAFTHTLH